MIGLARSQFYALAKVKPRTKTLGDITYEQLGWGLRKVWEGLTGVKMREGPLGHGDETPGE